MPPSEVLLLYMTFHFITAFSRRVAHVAVLFFPESAAMSSPFIRQDVVTDTVSGSPCGSNMAISYALSCCGFGVMMDFMNSGYR